MSEKKIKIGVDIDEVVVEFFRKYLELFNKRFEKNFKFEDWVRYGIWEFSGVAKEDALKLAEEFQNSKDFDNLDLVNGAKDALIILDQNCKIHFITSRPAEIEEKTKNFLKNILGESEFGLHFSRGVWRDSRSKGEICRELEIDFFIEDNSDYALTSAENGIKTFLLDKPWNQNYQKHENIVKVKNWSEILEKIKNENTKIF